MVSIKISFLLLIIISGSYCYDTINNIKYIHVLYTVTKHSGYLLGLKASILSLVTNLDSKVHLNIYVFVAQEDRMFVDRNVLEHLQDKTIVDAPDLSDITDYLEPAIEKAKYRVILAVFGCDELPETLPKHLRFENTDTYQYIEDAEVLWCRYTALDYLNILVGVVHLIYIDTDTIITKDISSMIPEDIDEQHLYAVENKKIKNKDMWVSLCENTPSSIYNDFCEKYSFANGVFVMNLDHWYLNRYMDKMEEMMSTFPEPYIADTAILNMLYYDTYGKLDSKFNAMGLGIGKRYPDVFADSAYILHWTGPLKWWNDATNNHLVKSYYPENYDSYYMNKILQEDDII